MHYSLFSLLWRSTNAIVSRIPSSHPGARVLPPLPRLRRTFPGSLSSWFQWRENYANTEKCYFTSTQIQLRWGGDTFPNFIFPVCCWMFANPGLLQVVGCKYDLQWLAVTAAGSRCDSCSSCGSYCSAAGCRTIQYQVQGRTGLEKVKLKMQMVKNKTGLNIMFTSNAD